jgi:hypothetical protein
MKYMGAILIEVFSIALSFNSKSYTSRLADMKTGGRKK